MVCVCMCVVSKQIFLVCCIIPCCESKGSGKKSWNIALPAGMCISECLCACTKDRDKDGNRRSDKRLINSYRADGWDEALNRISAHVAISLSSPYLLFSFTAHTALSKGDKNWHEIQPGCTYV